MGTSLQVRSACRPPAHPGREGPGSTIMSDARIAASASPSFPVSAVRTRYPRASRPTRHTLGSQGHRPTARQRQRAARASGLPAIVQGTFSSCRARMCTSRPQPASQPWPKHDHQAGDHAVDVPVPGPLSRDPARCPATAITMLARMSSSPVMRNARSPARPQRPKTRASSGSAGRTRSAPCPGAWRAGPAVRRRADPLDHPPVGQRVPQSHPAVGSVGCWPTASGPGTARAQAVTPSRRTWAANPPGCAGRPSLTATQIPNKISIAGPADG